MSSHDFIIDQIVFSYSSLNTYYTCPYSFKLNYIDKRDKLENFFGQYGSLIHDTIFQYFSDKLDVYELTGYFLENYDKVMTSPPPPYPAGMEAKYKEGGIEFFNNFSFDKSKYDIKLMEEKIDVELENGLKFVAKPDLVLFNKEMGTFALMDYKTSAPFRVDKRSGKEIVDKKKLEGYYTQMYLYTYSLRNFLFTPIDHIVLWFTRPEKHLTVLWNEEHEKQAVAWLLETVEKIKADEEFIPCDVVKNNYFCRNLCSVRESCEYKLEVPLDLTRSNNYAIIQE